MAIEEPRISGQPIPVGLELCANLIKTLENVIKRLRLIVLQAPCPRKPSYDQQLPKNACMADPL